jgi:3-hydroxybutyryl-CoA dehydrogenase
MAARRVYIIGERALVQEYARLCSVNGYAVSVRFNGDTPSIDRRRTTGVRQLSLRALPKGVRILPTPARGTDVALELSVLDTEQKQRNLAELDRALGPSVPIFSSSVTITVAEQSLWIEKPGRLIGIGALPSLLDGILIELAVAPQTTPETVRAASDFLTSLTKESALVHDSIGMVLPRIIATLANEACFALREGVASRSDIDTAMRLGTNYPYGPFEWTERIGIGYVHAVMSALQRFYSEDRYRVAPLLRQAALLGAFPC